MVDEAESAPNIQVVYLDDPIWWPAIEALQKHGDATAIAALLQRQERMPPWIGRYLGIMLDPPKGYRGTLLRAKVPKGNRSRAHALNRLVEKRKLALRIQELKGDGPLEPAIVQLMEAEGFVRSELFEAWRLRGPEIVLEVEKILGHVDPGDGESEEK